MFARWFGSSSAKKTEIEIYAHIDVGYNNAVFIMGNHQKLGDCLELHRLECVADTGNLWKIPLAACVAGSYFSFKIGPYGDEKNSVRKITSQDHYMTSTSSFQFNKEAKQEFDLQIKNGHVEAKPSSVLPRLK